MKPKSKSRELIEAVVIALFAALVLRQFVIASYKVPTGSMENTVLIGDFMFVNKFVYGAKTPEWIGIPFTRFGFDVPWFRFPAITDPDPYDVIVFKYPVDPHLDYIKRCIAVGGQTVEIINKRVYVDGKPFPRPPHLKFIDPRILERDNHSFDVFTPMLGSRDNFGPLYIPKKGDRITLNERNFSIYKNAVERYKKDISLVWRDGGAFLNGAPIREYEFDQNFYFAMGDNRDNSLDSRAWGFVPHEYIVGTPLIIWLSWNSKMPAYRLFNKIRWERLGSVVR